MPETKSDNSQNSYMSDVVWDKSKNTYSDEELKEIVKQHGLWLDTEGKEGKRADLSDAVLINVDLHGLYLQQAILQDVDLRGADLREAHLQGVNLLEADLLGADLREAHLQGAYLQGANLRGANLSGADLLKTNLLGANIARAKFAYAKNWKDAIGIPQEVIKIALETLIKKQDKKIEELGEKLKEEKERVDTQDLQKIKVLKDELAQAKKEKDNLENQLTIKMTTYLGANIEEAQKALANSLDNADKRIKEYSITARIVGIGAIILIILDLSAIIYLGFHYEAFLNSLEKIKEFGAWALTLYSFPILIVFSIAVTLLRHQKKLLDEVRHYSSEKRQIELYSGLLKASQYSAKSLNDPQQSAEYVHKTFTAIRDRILSEQPHTNTAGSAIEQEAYEEPLKVLTDAHSKLIDVFTKNKA